MATSAATLSHVKFFIIDLQSLNDKPDEIKDSLNKLKMLNDEMRIIIIADDEKSKDTNRDLLRRIFDLKIYNIITEFSESELEHCITKGKTEEEAKEFFLPRPKLETDEQRKEYEKAVTPQTQQAEVPEETAPEEPSIILLPNKDFRKKSGKENISVAVCAAEPHAGATHNALLMARFLKDLGFRVCYLEANASDRKIFFAQRFYQNNFIVNKHLLQIRGLDLYSEFNMATVMDCDYDFYIFDFGVFNDSNSLGFLTKDIRVIVSGAKPWELKNLSEPAKLIGPKVDVHFLLNNAAPGMESTIKEFMGPLASKAYFAEHVPDPFGRGKDETAFKQIFKDYIIVQEVRPKQQKKTGIFGLGSKRKAFM
jgi:hypothetical protein